MFGRRLLDRISRQEAEVDNLKDSLDLLRKELRQTELRVERQYVTKDRFKPVMLVAFGLVALLCAGVVSALLSLVVSGGP